MSQLLLSITERLTLLVLITPIISIVTYCVVSYYTSPLRKYPGPRLAGLYHPFVAI